MSTCLAYVDQEIPHIQSLGCLSIHECMYARAAIICIVQCGRFCTIIREIFRVTFNIIRTKFPKSEFFKFAHQNMERSAYFQGNFCRIRESWQLWYAVMAGAGVGLTSASELLYQLQTLWPPFFFNGRSSHWVVIFDVWSGLWQSAFTSHKPFQFWLFVREDLNPPLFLSFCT